jgi:hypothetical protein
VHECSKHLLPAFGMTHGCYSCVKDRVLNGGRDKLSSDELTFVGVTGFARPPACGTSPPTTPTELDAVLSADTAALAVR